VIGYSFMFGVWLMHLFMVQVEVQVVVIGCLDRLL
jgi:hypothetical protein